MGKEICLTIGGNNYRLTTLTARQTQEFLEFAKTAMPDPVAEVIATANQLPDGPVRDRFIDKHLDAAFESKKLRGTPSDPDLEAFTVTPQGSKKLFGLMFKANHPNLTEEEVYELVVQAITEHGEEAFKDLHRAGNHVPRKEEDVERDYFRSRRVGPAAPKAKR